MYLSLKITVKKKGKNVDVGIHRIDVRSLLVINPIAAVL